MKKIIYSVLVFFAVVSVSFPYASCNKDCEKPKTCDSVCVVRGPFSGTFTNQFNQSGAFAYTLADYNFTSGSGSLTDAPTAFGSFENNCDSIKIKTWNSINNNYYFFAGKFSNNRTRITGTYRNLNSATEVGTFILNKQ